VLQGKGNVQHASTLFLADHHYLVGRGLEGLLHGAYDLAGFVHCPQADEVHDVEFALPGRVQLGSVDHQILAPESARSCSILDAFQVDEVTLRGPPNARDASPAARHDGFDALAEVPTRACGPHP
jgi:hypothetical protein